MPPNQHSTPIDESGASHTPLRRFSAFALKTISPGREPNGSKERFGLCTIISLLVLVLLSWNVLVMRYFQIDFQTSPLKFAESRSLRNIFKEEIESYGT